MKLRSFPLNICIILILLSLTTALSAGVIEDRTGDFDDTDVISVRVDTKGSLAVFTITYSEEVIGSLWGGAGGVFGIDSDRNVQTGLEKWTRKSS